MWFGLHVFISWSGNLPPDVSALFPSQDFCLYSPHEMSAARKRKAPPLGSPEAPNLELFKMVTKPPKKCDRRGCERFSAYPFCFVQATDRWICETVNLNVVQSTVWYIVTHGPVPVFLTRFQICRSIIMQGVVARMSRVEAFATRIKIEPSDQSPFWEPIKGSRTCSSNLTFDP